MVIVIYHETATINLALKILHKKAKLNILVKP